MLPFLAAATLSASYHGDFLTHPGAAGRSTWTVAQPMTWEAELGGWWHPRNLVTAYVRTGPALSVTGPRGGVWGAFLHGGVQHGVWATPTYRVDGADIRRAALAGDTWAHVASGVELGRERWFVRPQASLRIPTFHGVGIDLAVEVGLRFGGAP